MFNVAKANKEIPSELVRKIDLGKLAEKINRERDLFKIELCLPSVARASEKKARELLNYL